MFVRFLRGLLILVLATAAGFAFGRYGLGERLLAPTLAAIGTQREKPPADQSLPSISDAAEPDPEPAPEINLDVPPEPGEQRSGRRSRPERLPEEEAEPRVAPEPVETAPAEETPPEVQEQPPGPTTRFSLQAGRFGNEERARLTADQLASMGYPARVQSQGQGADKEYRVLVGSFPTEGGARRQAERLRADGFDAFISKEQR